jgi:hypothetical protein
MTSHPGSNLLWTGGWDSTYRLLELVLVHGREVQPHYLIDTNRASLGVELRAMRRIKSRLFEQHPEARKLLRPVCYREVGDIAPYPAFSEKVARLVKRVSTGTQWDWIGRFAQETRIADLEVCLVRADDQTCRALSPLLPPEPPSDSEAVALSDRDPDDLVYQVFRFYRFPLIYTTKPEIRTLAERHGFAELMELTWFCHHPRGKERPCGTCTPCRYAIRLGMGKRVPLSGRLRYHARRVLRIDEAKRWVKRRRAQSSRARASA